MLEISVAGKWVILWLVVSVITSLMVSFKRRKSSHSLDLSDFINILIGYAGTGSAFSLGCRAIYNEELQDLLGANIYTLLIGVVAVIWLSLRQVAGVYSKEATRKSND